MTRVVLLGEGAGPKATETMLQARGHRVDRAQDVAAVKALLGAESAAVLVALPAAEESAADLVAHVQRECPGAAVVGACPAEARGAGWAALQQGAADVTLLPLHPEEVTWRLERAMAWAAGGGPGARAAELAAQLQEVTQDRDRALGERAALEATLLRLAVADPLTGLANLRAFEDRLRSEARRARRFLRPLCVLVMDVDHANRLEQAYGTEALSAALQRMGDHLREGLRDTDLAARTDDDEFSLVLPETPLAGARELALSLRRVLASASDPTVGRVTVSMGVGALDPATHEDGAALWAAARANLVRAKQAGRDRVEG
jgi:diguanylate cyclase (GGDEF)-like protein